jgi:hypothetical protein
MAVVAGFEGEKIIEEKISEHKEQEQQPPADDAQQ